MNDPPVVTALGENSATTVDILLALHAAMLKTTTVSLGQVPYPFFRSSFKAKKKKSRTHTHTGIRAAAAGHARKLLREDGHTSWLPPYP